MNIEVFTACDFAQDAMGKLTVVGCFDTLNARSLPVKHPMMCIALRMRFMMHEMGRHVVRLEMIDPDGANVIPPFQGGIEVASAGADTTAINLVLSNIGLEFKTPGKHLIKLTIDEDPIASVPLHVRTVPQNS